MSLVQENEGVVRNQSGVQRPSVRADAVAAEQEPRTYLVYSARHNCWLKRSPHPILIAVGSAPQFGYAQWLLAICQVAKSIRYSFEKNVAGCINESLPDAFRSQKCLANDHSPIHYKEDAPRRFIAPDGECEQSNVNASGLATRCGQIDYRRPSLTAHLVRKPFLPRKRNFAVQLEEKLAEIIRLNGAHCRSLSRQQPDEITHIRETGRGPQGLALLQELKIPLSHVFDTGIDSARPQ